MPMGESNCFFSFHSLITMTFFNEFDKSIKSIHNTNDLGATSATHIWWSSVGCVSDSVSEIFGIEKVLDLVLKKIINKILDLSV